MSYKQLVKPDLRTKGDIGWCLDFVEKVFDSPNSGATATDSWKAARYPHRGAKPPKDVAVCVWWPYYEAGLDFGHVAVNVPGKGVLSSPYKQNNSQQWFSSLEECAQVLGLGKYRGWSEDLAGYRIVKKENDMYQGKTAKQWAEASKFWRKQTDECRKKLKANPAQKVLDKIKALVGK